MDHCVFCVHRVEAMPSREARHCTSGPDISMYHRGEIRPVFDRLEAGRLRNSRRIESLKKLDRRYRIPNRDKRRLRSIWASPSLLLVPVRVLIPLTTVSSKLLYHYSPLSLHEGAFVRVISKIAILFSVTLIGLIARKGGNKR